MKKKPSKAEQTHLALQRRVLRHMFLLMDDLYNEDYTPEQRRAVLREFTKLRSFLRNNCLYKKEK